LGKSDLIAFSSTKIYATAHIPPQPFPIVRKLAKKFFVCLSFRFEVVQLKPIKALAIRKPSDLNNVLSIYGSFLTCGNGKGLGIVKVYVSVAKTSKYRNIDN
jgi:hypothetical protein